MIVNSMSCLCCQHFVVDTESGGQVSFKKLLLNRCQEEFLKDKKDATQFEVLRKKVEEAATEVSTTPSSARIMSNVIVTSSSRFIRLVSGRGEGAGGVVGVRGDEGEEAVSRQHPLHRRVVQAEHVD